MSQQSRKFTAKLRQLHATGLCYVHHEPEKRFVEVPHGWWLWHCAYRQLAALHLDGKLIGVAKPADGYTLTFTELGPAIVFTRTAEPGYSIPSNYLRTLQRLLEWNPTLPDKNGKYWPRYTTLDEIWRAIGEEAFEPQRRVIEIVRGFAA